MRNGCVLAVLTSCRRWIQAFYNAKQRKRVEKRRYMPTPFARYQAYQSKKWGPWDWTTMVADCGTWTADQNCDHCGLCRLLTVRNICWVIKFYIAYFGLRRGFPNKFFYEAVTKWSSLYFWWKGKSLDDGIHATRKLVIYLVRRFHKINFACVCIDILYRNKQSKTPSRHDWGIASCRFMLSQCI